MLETLYSENKTKQYVDWVVFIYLPRYAGAISSIDVVMAEYNSWFESGKNTNTCFYK